MTHTLDYTLVRDDDEIELEIAYSVAPLIPARGPSWDSPGEPADGGEIEDMFIAGPDGSEFTVTAAELEKIERHVYETHDYDEEYCDV